jgi:two-component system osmolarity sensor histidine kinase EnvZ
MVAWLKQVLPRGLLGRSLLIIVAPLVILQIVATYVFYTNHWDTVTRRLALGVAGDIGAVVDLLAVFPENEDRLEILSITARTMDLRLVFQDGGIIGKSETAPEGLLETSLLDALRERVQRPFQVDFDDFDREVQVRVQLSRGIVEFYVPRKRLFSSTSYIFILWMIGTSLLLLGIATIFMRNQVRSVRKLASAADGFGKGRDTPNIKPEGATEVRLAAIAFNLMRERLKRQIDQRTEMLAGVSHDLRTPLTRMKLQLAIMDGTEGTAELSEDVSDMERMIEGYLAFARGEGSEAVQSVRLDSAVRDLVARFLREGHKVWLDDAMPEITLRCRPNALDRALMNLIGNACRYGKNVAVAISQSGDTAEIVVDDDGPGIPDAQREHVFRAFTRLESSRNPKTGGMGLGLTIARDIARGHGGDITLEDSPLGGLRAKVRLPL